VERGSCFASAGSTGQAPPIASSSWPLPVVTSVSRWVEPTATYRRSTWPTGAQLSPRLCRFNIVDDQPLTKREYANALAAAARKTAWLRVPRRAALLLGDRSTSLTRSLRVSNVRFKTATGWAPRYPSAREGWAATATALGYSRQ
jgi:hypothetical protein